MAWPVIFYRWLVLEGDNRVRRIRIAFVKYGGMAVGGTELNLQVVAMGLPKDLFEVDYYYCDAAPNIGLSAKPPLTDPDRLAVMRASGVRVIQFHVGARDLRTNTHDWVDTDFWDIFPAGHYDLVQTGKAGPAEYPFVRMQERVVELVALAWCGVDRSPNIVWSVHPSSWQRTEWCRMGGAVTRSCVIPNPAVIPAAGDNLRQELGIPEQAVVAGLLQRNDNAIFSAIPLESFACVFRPDRHFVIMNGGSRYREQAQKLQLANVHFLPQQGRYERVSAFFRTIDFFAHGRKDGETYGTVLAEALAIAKWRKGAHR